MRFRKSIKIIPGVRINLSKSSVSTSVGGRGATINVSKRGIRSTLSLPGTGISWSSKSGWTESKRSHPTDEIEHLRGAAAKAIDAVSKDADNISSISARIDRAIDILNGGRGLTKSKAQTFEKRVLTEEQKLNALEEQVREHSMFLNAIEMRLRAMSFGIFARRSKRQRDSVAEAVAICAHEAKGIENRFDALHRALSDKLSEVQDKIDDA